MTTLYEKDFHAWCFDQAEKLRSGILNLDFLNLAEEMESLGNSNQKELVNRLIELICHILKWEYQAHLRSHGWVYSIREQQERIKKLIQKNPSLKHYYEESLQDAMPSGRRLAAIQTQMLLEQFPEWIEVDLEKVYSLN